LESHWQYMNVLFTEQSPLRSNERLQASAEGVLLHTAQEFGACRTAPLGACPTTHSIHAAAP
jgi:hypothetical protein